MIVIEILKYTIPGLVAFLTAWYLVRQFLKEEKEILIAKQAPAQTAKEKDHNVKQFRMQAYERLVLFCERISIPNLVFRMRTAQMTVQELHAAILLAIQQEFDYNVTQQVYVSNALWQIISIAKNDTIRVVNDITDKLDPDADSKLLANALFNFVEKQESGLATQKAIEAIKKEAELLINNI